MKLIYCGFSDTNNVGDYAIYRTNVQLFGEELVPYDDAELGRDQVNILGGGTFLPYALRDRFPRRHINCAIGVGVQPTKNNKRFGLLTRLSLKSWKFAFLGVRGQQSQDILAQNGIQSSITGDTVLALKWERAPATQTSPILGVNLVGEEMKRLGSQQRTFTEVRDACERLISEGMRIHVFPFCRSDIASLTEFASSLGCPDNLRIIDFWNPPISESLDLFLQEIARCEVFVTERLHAAVFSTIANVPFVPIGYKLKVRDFVDSLNNSRLSTLGPDQLRAERLLEQVETLRTERSVRDELETVVAGYEKLLVAGASRIKEIVANADLS